MILSYYAGLLSYEMHNCRHTTYSTTYSQYTVRLMAPRVWRTLASATQAL